MFNAKRTLLKSLLLSLFLLLILLVINLLTHKEIAQKLIATFGLVACLSGFVQLDVSGLFDALLKPYYDSDKCPPSQIVRVTIDDPDRPVRMAIRNTIFFDMKTGYYLIITGTIAQILAVWL